jgi:hypothetical protein
MSERVHVDPFAGLRAKTRLSDPFDLGGRRVRFRLLDQREHQWCRTSALHEATANLMERFPEPERVQALLNHPLVYDTLTEAQDVYQLSAALCDESGSPLYTGTPDDAAKAFADTFSPIERSHLASEYFSFAMDADPSIPTDKEIEELADEVRKNPFAPSLSHCGSNTLRLLCRTLASPKAELPPSPTAELSAGT